MLGYLIGFLFWMIPAAAIVFFIISLCLFISAHKKNKQKPGSIDIQIIKSRKIMLIISSVTAGFLAVIAIGFVILLSMAIKNM